MRIPTGDTQGQTFGQVVARPVKQEEIDPNAMGAGVGRAVQQAGQVGMNLAEQEITQANQEARRVEAEAKRVKTLTTTASVQNGLADLHDEIDRGLNDGSIDKGGVQQMFAERSGKIVGDAMEQVDPEYKPLVNATLLNDVNRFKSSVTKMVTKRDQADILAGGQGYMSEMERFAARGATEADQAIANVSAFWSATGPQAGRPKNMVDEDIRRFADTIRFRQASDMVNADPAAAMTALKNKDFLPELDPDRRAALIQSADAAVLRAQHRAQVEAEANAKKLERTWEAAQTVFQAGKMPTPAYATLLTKTFKGTPYEEPLKMMMEEGPASSSFVTQPVAAQAQSLVVMQNKMNSGGATPAEVKQYEKMDKAHKATLSDIKADPYMAAAERGVLTKLEPLTMDLQQLPGQLAKRSEAAMQVSAWAGQEVSLFRPDEADKLGGVLLALPPKDRAGALSGLSKTMTPGQMKAFAKQLGAKDEALASAALLSANDARTSGGRLVSEIILTGSDAAREQRVKFPSGVSPATVRADIDKATRGAYLSEDMNRAAGDAAFAVYQGLLVEGQTPDVAQAVNLATGGIMEVNGSKFVKPWGMKDAEVMKVLRDHDTAKLANITGGKPVLVGGRPVPLEDLAKYMPGATLGPSPKPGQYTVQIGGRWVDTENGAPLLIKLREN